MTAPDILKMLLAIGIILAIFIGGAWLCGFFKKFRSFYTHTPGFFKKGKQMEDGKVIEVAFHHWASTTDGRAEPCFRVVVKLDRKKK